MPKLKTKRSAVKRFKITKNGKSKKVLRRKAFHSHILTKKDARRKRRLKKTAVVSSADRDRVLYALGKK